MTWEEVDGVLRSIAKRRAALDVEEARWLRRAEEIELWRELGMVSMIDYMERALGYGPHNAKERLRVAHALEELPQMEAALERGEVSFSAVRELTRIVVPETEEVWLAHVEGKNLRQVEDLVAGREEGDLPTDPEKPHVRDCVLTFKLRPETYAALRESRVVLEDEQGRSLSDDELVSALCRALLGGDRERAQHQISVVQCETCKAAWQDGGGRRIAIGAAAFQRAECDAEHIGSLDAAHPERAHQAVPPATQRFVIARDRGRCSVPGCRSARSLEIHHIVHRAHGGTNDPSNLIVLCSSCHAAHHDGRLHIRGTATALEVDRTRAIPTRRAIDVQSPDYVVAIVSSADLSRPNCSAMECGCP